MEMFGKSIHKQRNEAAKRNESFTKQQLLGSYQISKQAIMPNIIRNTGDWSSILRYVQSCDDIKKRVCYGCPTSRLYDNNGKEYKISRRLTLEQVKLIVEEIRKINT